jgi:hypothetical protein
VQEKTFSGCYKVIIPNENDGFFPAISEHLAEIGEPNVPELQL